MVEDKEVWIFLSHSNDDYESVRRIRNILEDLNTRPLMFFLKCLNDNDEIEDLIKREIKARTRFILCDSENARKSNWVQKEIKYISEINKSYDIIDISAPEQDIRNKLKEFFRKEHLYISYPRELMPAIDVIAERLSKYDFATTFIDKFDIQSNNFLEDFEDNILKAVERGHFISLLSHHSTRTNRFSQFELDLAIEHDSNKNAILPIYLDTISKDYFKSKLVKYECIDLSDRWTNNHGQPNSKDIPYRYGSLDDDKSLKILGDDIVNSILVRLQGWGNIETYGDNFRKGNDNIKDDEEADKLSCLLVEHLEGVDRGNYFNGPGMLFTLGQLYATGTCVRKDIDKARQYYEEAHDVHGVIIDHYLDRLK